MTDLVVTSPWLEPPEPKQPARIGRMMRLPPGRVDTWDFVVGLGSEVHPGHWLNETDMNKAFGPDEFRIAGQYYHDDGVKQWSIDSWAQLTTFAAKEKGEAPPNQSEILSAVKQSHSDKLDDLRPYFARYREIVDAVLQNLINGKIKAEVAHKTGRLISIEVDAWRSFAAQKALVEGVAYQHDGFIVDSKNPEDFGHLVFPKSAVSVTKASIKAPSIDIDQACEDFLFQLMLDDPFGNSTRKDHTTLAKEEGVFPSERRFRNARAAAIQRLRTAMPSEEWERIRYDRRGKRPA